MIAPILFIAFVGAALYAYAFYPLALVLLSLGKKPPAPATDPSDEALPAVTLLIAARDEEAIIAEKIENSLRLNYPPGKLRVVVVSDGSTDGTDEVVRGFEPRGVALFRLNPGRGKSIARNGAAEAATGDVLVMSDANAMYEPEAIRKLVRHFSDPSVGAVCGELRLMHERGDENLYWRYEKWITRLESRFHSIIGANGSIYAIRKSLYAPLPAEVDDDFVEPLHALLRGNAVRYEPEAVSIERGIESTNIVREFSAKRRTVQRGIQSLYYLSRTEAPFRRPALAFELVSHKIFKWLVPFFLIGILVTSVFLIDHPVFADAFAIQLLLYGCAIAGIATGKRFFYIPAFLVLTNAAAFAGVLSFLTGSRNRTWRKQRA
jgi:cellulose synthase/poly-beta-1,6-N-acetylglucosamine synthase-like glycosyltransferase